LLLYLFPDGRFVPSWSRFLAPLPYLLFLVALWFEEKFVTPGWMILLLLAFVFGGVASQIYRYWKVSHPEQRQQTKWVIFAIAVWAPLLLSGIILPLLVPALGAKTQAHFLFDVLCTYILGALVAALIPLSIAVSIFRYRLWDIDIIIRRTLVYASLTLMLGLFYFGLVTLLQGALSSITGQHSPVIIVLSTLAIAALFNPLRRQLQSGVDRLFYRQKYSVELALAGFSETARSEADPDLFTKRLVATIEDTLQPEHISLWLSSRLNAAGEQQVEAISSFTPSPVYINKETSS
jgi:hypothetical protein